MAQNAVKLSPAERPQPFQAATPERAIPAEKLTEQDVRRLEIRRRVALAVDQIRALPRT